MLKRTGGRAGFSSRRWQVPPRSVIARRHLSSSDAAAGAHVHVDDHARVAARAPLNTVVLVGSTREKRIGGKVAKYIVSRLEERGHIVTVLDPRTSSDGFFMTLMEKAFFHYKADEEIPRGLVETAAILRAADAYVVVTPEMNHTIAPGLTNMMNYFGASIYAKRPSGIATYSAGMWGGARCAVALRAYLSELGCLPVSATFQQAGAWKTGAFDEVRCQQSPFGLRQPVENLAPMHFVFMKVVG